MSSDPRVVIAQSPMRMRQIVAIGICIALNALDGFDILAISFASPGIAADWNIDRAALGVVLSMELIGMSVGAILLGIVADRIGRRPVLLTCIATMACGMALAGRAAGLTELSAYRLLTGFGIGGMLACINAMVSELANRRAKAMAVALMSAGYPAGAVLGGSLASDLLVDGSWRSIFELGAIATAAMLPIAWLLLPESVSYLMLRETDDRARRVNRSLTRLGHAPLEVVSSAEPTGQRVSLKSLFTGRYGTTTQLLILAYFTHIMTFYFLLKWIPKIVADFAFAPATAGGVLVWANVGGLLGALLFSAFAWRLPVRPMLIITMLASAVAVAIFGQTGADLERLSFMAAAAGFFTNPAVLGMYAVIAAAYPAALRAGGTGVVIGIGRGGAACGPIVAGVLFSLDLSLSIVAITMAAGSLVAAIAIWGLRPLAPQD